MSFLFPLGFLGFISLPLVVALHLFRERQQKYPLSSLWLWRFLEPQMHGAKLRQVPLTWLLVLDLSIAALLSLALTMPRIPTALFSSPSIHKVFLLDVTTSMLAKDITPSRFIAAKNDITRQLRLLTNKDIGTMIIFREQASYLGDTRNQSIQAIEQSMEQIQPGGKGNAMVDAFTLGQSYFSEEMPNELHVYSDGSYDASLMDNYPNIIEHHSIGKSSFNQSIIQISAQTLPDHSTNIFARLANFSEKDVERILTLQIKEAPISSYKILLPAQKTITQTWTVDSDSQPDAVSVILLGEDDLPIDDASYLGLQPINRLSVTLAAEFNEPFTRALHSFSNVEMHYTPINQYTPQASTDLTILRGFTPAVFPSGTLLLVNPQGELASSNNPPVSINSQKVTVPIHSKIILNDETKFPDIDFSGVRWEKIWTLNSIPEGYKPLISLGELPLLLEGWTSATHVYILLADFESGNFKEHPAFLILLGNILASIEKPVSEGQIALGKPLSLPELGKEFASFTLTTPNQTVTQYRSNWQPQWEDTFFAGFYNINLLKQTGNITTYTVGVNAGDAQESDIQPHSILGNQKIASPNSDKNQFQDIDLSPWLLVSALVLMLIEAKVAWR